ncbi:glycosyltransferase [Alloalcanivorax mobilis]|uniref:glycosyltransferase n=1 Tax=Alloalcanivorax mobilis TaxID=2019569 RepID=UPI000C77056A|nr:glycosyltransferase [Alloalcanivorax mobilis]
MSSSLVVVVVTYNRLSHLKVGIEALGRQDCDAIVVVDNCSTDGTQEWLLEEAVRNERLDVVLAPRNLGGAGGFELGFRHAMERYHAEWLVCFDDDAYPQPGAFRTFLDSDLEGVDAAAAAVYLPDGEICEMNRPSLNPFWHRRLFLKTVLGKGRQGFHLEDRDYCSKMPVDIDSTSFVGFFVRRDMIQRVGLPEGRLFIYGDDVLYTLKVSDSGGRICFLPWVTFTHDCSTFANHRSTYAPLWKAYYTYRNGLRVYHTAAGWLFWLFAPLKIAQWLLNARLYDHPTTYLKVVYLAVRDAMTGHYGRRHEDVVKMCESRR